MITKAKRLQFTTSDGKSCDGLDEAKVTELGILANADNSQNSVSNALFELVSKPREAIAILRFGLPRKPRAVKAKSGRPRKSNPAPVATT